MNDIRKLLFNKYKFGNELDGLKISRYSDSREIIRRFIQII